MSIIVQKFGGTSVGDLERIKNVALNILKKRENNSSVVIVVSAMSGVTNQLINYCNGLSNLSHSYQLQEYDVALSSGELVSSALLALALQQDGAKAISLQSWQIPILTNDNASSALISSIDTTLILKYISEGIIPVISGFQGVDTNNRITTLGRGGSDTTAAALAAALAAERCDIYTDVEGVFTTDPRFVQKARRIDKLSYEEMLEFAGMGAKVLHPRAVQIAMKYSVPLNVLSSFSDAEGTMILSKDKIMETRTITGIAYNKNIAEISVVYREYDTIQQIILRLGDASINIEIMRDIDYKAKIFSFIVALTDVFKVEEILKSLETDYKYSRDIALVSIIGLGVKQDAKIMHQIFSTLSNHNIQIIMMVTSEIKISILIQEDFTERAVRVLHNSLGLEDE